MRVAGRVERGAGLGRETVREIPSPLPESGFLRAGTWRGPESPFPPRSTRGALRKPSVYSTSFQVNVPLKCTQQGRDGAAGGLWTPGGSTARRPRAGGRTQPPAARSLAPHASPSPGLPARAALGPRCKSQCGHGNPGPTTPDKSPIRPPAFPACRSPLSPGSPISAGARRTRRCGTQGLLNH